MYKKKLPKTVLNCRHFKIAYHQNVETERLILKNQKTESRIYQISQIFNLFGIIIFYDISINIKYVLIKGKLVQLNNFYL